jgi:hypothetical protein
MSPSWSFRFGFSGKAREWEFARLAENRTKVQGFVPAARKHKERHDFSSATRVRRCLGSDFKIFIFRPRLLLLAKMARRVQGENGPASR